MAVNAHAWAVPRTLLPAPTAAVRHRQLRVDLGIAVTVIAYSIVVALPFPPAPPHGWRGYLTVMTFVVLPLAGRRVWPRVTHGVVTTASVAGLLLKLPGVWSNTVLIAMLISTYSFAAHARTSRPWIGWPMALPFLAVVAFRPGVQLSGLPILAVEMAMACYFGSLQRQRAGLAATLDHRALQLEASPEDAERLAVHHERGRIAADLQRLVTAAVEAMVAGARDGRRLIRRDVDRAKEVARSVADTGRDALNEMRRLLDLLRGRGSEQLHVPPTLETLATLVRGEAASAGIDVQLTISGDPSVVSAPCQRAAHRIVEEALAMATDRRGNQPLVLRVEVVAGQLRIHAARDGSAQAEPVPVAPFDSRVAGLHERVALLGGELRSHLGEGGGFTLEASLPAGGPDDRGLAALITPNRRPAPLETSLESSPRRPVAALGDALRSRPWLQDALLAATLVTVSVWEVMLYPEPAYEAVRDWRAAVGLVAIASTLLLRRRAPVGALLLACALEVARDLLMLRWTNGILLILAILIFTVASRRSPTMAAGAVVLAVASHGIFLGRVIESVYTTGRLGLPVTAATTVTFMVLLRVIGIWIFAAFAGRTLRARDALNGELTQRVQRLLEHRDLQARFAVADERRRVARELHDIVAHSLSIMVLQSGVAGSLASRDPARALHAFALIERLGVQARAELDLLLGLLESDGTPAQSAPLPQRLGQLIEDAQASGLKVTLIVDGDREPAGHLSLHAYRIIQEALTNARKHASGASVQVKVTHFDGGIEVEVINDAPRLARRPVALVPGGGNGLMGMRERVGLFGGELVAGPRPDGGFEVRARIAEPALA